MTLYGHKLLGITSEQAIQAQRLSSVVCVNTYAKQKHLWCKKGEANQKQQLFDYKSIHSYTCD